MTPTTAKETAPVPADFTFSVEARFLFEIPASDREADYAFPPAEEQLDELRRLFEAEEDVLSNLSALIGAMSAAGIRPTVEIGDLTGHTTPAEVTA